MPSRLQLFSRALRLAAALAPVMAGRPARAEELAPAAAGTVRAWIVVAPDRAGAETSPGQEDADALAACLAERGATVTRTSPGEATRLALWRGWLRLGLASRPEDTLLVWWSGILATSPASARRPDLLLVPAGCPPWTEELNGLSLDAWAEVSSLFPARRGVLWLHARLATNAVCSRLVATPLEVLGAAAWRAVAAAADGQPLESGPHYSRFAGGMLGWLRAMDTLADVAQPARLDSLERRLRVEADGRQTPVTRYWSVPPPAGDRAAEVSRALRAWAENEPAAFAPLPALIADCRHLGLTQTAIALGQAALDLSDDDTQRRAALRELAEADIADGRHDRALLRLRQALGTGRPPPAEAAALWMKTGRARAAGGSPAGAAEAYQQALQLARQAGDSALDEQADSLRELARLAADEGRSFIAAGYLDEEIALRRRVRPLAPAALADALERSARQSRQAGDLDAALRKSSEALALRRDAGLDAFDLSETHAGWLEEAGKSAEAETLRADLWKQSESPLHARPRARLAAALGRARLRAGQFEEARQIFKEGLQALQTGPDPADKARLLDLHEGLANALRGLRKNQESAAEFRLALASLDEAREPGRGAQMWQTLSALLEENRDWIGSLSACQRAAELWERAGHLDPPAQAALYLRRARLQCTLQNAARAALYADRAVEELARSGTTNVVEFAATCRQVSAALSADGESERARTWAQRALDALPSDGPDLLAERIEAWRTLTAVQLDAGRVGPAIASAHTARKLMESAQPPDALALARWWRTIAGMEVQNRNPDEALEAYGQALNHLAGRDPLFDPDVTGTHVDLARLMNDLRRYDESLRWLEPLYRQAQAVSDPSPLARSIRETWSHAYRALNTEAQAVDTSGLLFLISEPPPSP